MVVVSPILGNQLFANKFFSKNNRHYFMMEDNGLCTHYKYHKHKLIHFLSSMRDKRDELLKKDYILEYVEFDIKKNYIDELEKFLKKVNATRIEMYAIEDKFFEEQFLRLAAKLKIEIEFKESPMFLVNRREFSEYVDTDKKLLLNNFYIDQRKKFSILLNDRNEPIGGSWNFDKENQKKIPKKYDVPVFPIKIMSSKNISEVSIIVDKYFSDHPGSTENYWIPTNRAQALKWLKDFIKDRLSRFGTFQDAIDQRDPFLFHSLLSPFLNMGLLTPQEVVQAIEDALDESDLSNLNSVEGFIRQVLGWREFVRGIYQNYSQDQESKNFFSHTRKLTNAWYEGTTGIPVLDDSINKAQKYGYCHHIERLMVIGNLMLLLEIHPHEVHRWFMEMFVDSSDWVMGPNVYGMSQFSDGGLFATKPYICGSNYLLKMGHYKKGSWCDAVDGLYWSFIERNKDFFKSNYRMAMMVKLLDKIDPEKKRRIFSAADKLRLDITTQGSC